jgi:hypothetical protein
VTIAACGAQSGGLIFPSRECFRAAAFGLSGGLIFVSTELAILEMLLSGGLILPSVPAGPRTRDFVSMFVASSFARHHDHPSDEGVAFPSPVTRRILAAADQQRDGARLRAFTALITMARARMPREEAR